MWDDLRFHAGFAARCSHQPESKFGYFCIPPIKNTIHEEINNIQIYRRLEAIKVCIKDKNVDGRGNWQRNLDEDEADLWYRSEENLFLVVWYFARNGELPPLVDDLINPTIKDDRKDDSETSTSSDGNDNDLILFLKQYTNQLRRRTDQRCGNVDVNSDVNLDGNTEVVASKE